MIKLTKDRKLVVENTDKDRSNTVIKFDNINAIYVAGNNNIENPELAIYVMTDFDEKVLIYKSEYALRVRSMYRKLASALNKMDSNFKDYFPKCINLSKVKCVEWQKVPFKYIAIVEFKNRSLRFKTYEDEFNKIIDDWSSIQKTL